MLDETRERKLRSILAFAVGALNDIASSNMTLEMAQEAAKRAHEQVNQAIEVLDKGVKS